MEAYVVGGGPTAADFVWPNGVHARRGGVVIACHEHAHRLPFVPTFQLSADWAYWRDNFPKPGSIGVWVDHDRAPFRCPGAVLKIPGRPLWLRSWGDTLEGGVMVGGCSGVAAVNFAYILGATRIHLVGIDLDGPPGRPWDKWAAAFQFCYEALRERGVALVSHGRWQPNTD